MKAALERAGLRRTSIPGWPDVFARTEGDFSRFFILAPTKKKDYVIPYGYMGVSIQGYDAFMSAGAEADFLPLLFTHTANLDRESLGRSVFTHEYENYDFDAWASEVARVVARLPASEHELVGALSTRRVGEWDLDIFLNPFSPGADMAAREFSAWCAAKGISIRH